jgi:hypothetical protein
MRRHHAALWAAIGVGVVVWLVFVEIVLLGDIAAVDDSGRLFPGAADKASRIGPTASVSA